MCQCVARSIRRSVRLCTGCLSANQIKEFVPYFNQFSMMKKYQFKLCPTCNRERDFDVIIWSVVPCRKLRWICRKHSNDVARQVEIPGKSTILSCDKFIFVARHNFHMASKVTLHHYCRTLRYCKRCIFSLITCKVFAAFLAAFVRSIIKHLFHENLCLFTFWT